MQELNAARFIPEFILSFGAVLLLLKESFSSTPSSRSTVTWVSLGVLAATILSLSLVTGFGVGTAFYGLIVSDPVAVFTKMLMAAAAVLVFLLIQRSKEFDRSFAELASMVLTVLFGCFLMVSAKNLLMIYLGIETASIVSYLLAGVRKQDYRANEAALKYVVYGSLASAVMIFGMSYLYGVSGSLDFGTIQQALANKPIGRELLWMSLALIFAGFGYKISAAPFHMWTPDVYEGSPLPITAFFSVIPKAAGIVALTRFLFSALTQTTDSGYVFSNGLAWGQALSVVAVVTMFVGNLAALQQSNIKRLLAYSSISHAGFLILAISSGNSSGITAMLFYTLVYAFMNLGAFWIAGEVSSWTGTESVEGFRGLATRSPVTALLMSAFLFSLTGLPPFSGFIAKWYVFAAIIENKMITVALFAVVNTVIALFYYARIVRLMFFEKRGFEMIAAGSSETLSLARAPLVVAVILAVPTLVLGIYWEPVYAIVKMSSTLMGLK